MSLSNNPSRGGNGGKVKSSKEIAPQSTADRLIVPSKSKIVPVELQQLLLNIFKNAFSENFDSKLSGVIQQAKQHLFRRDFDNAFGSEDLREAYAMRWSSGRALAYTHIFYNLTPLTTRLLSKARADLGKIDRGSINQPQNALANAQNPSADAQNRAGNDNHIVCIGAGAGAEIIALGGYLNLLNRLAVCSDQKSRPHDEKTHNNPSQLRGKITIIDIADWDSVVRRLQSSMIIAPTISHYPSTEAKAANSALVEKDTMVLNFVKQDVLKMAIDQMPAIFTDATLVTLMFTLNELYSTSIGATTNLLLSLTMLLSAGALLLVVDSPGSYSTVSVGKASGPDNQSKGKKYPMQWLLDHTLLESAAIGSSKNVSGEHQWERLESKDSEWFRLPTELRYPIDLENMRYQVHLYRRM